VPKVAVVPYVFADRERHGAASDLHALAAGPWLEIAILVEHVVSRQQGLPDPRLDASLCEQRSRVEERTPVSGRVGFRQTHEHRRQQRRPDRQLLGNGIRAAHELGLEQKIARRVSGD
jgi:hypothetical protein